MKPSIYGLVASTIMVDETEGRSSTLSNTADLHVGAMVRKRRTILGLSQQQFAEMIGVTYQQAHKYERGLNRISAGRLFEIAQVLAVPITYFFEGITKGAAARPADASACVLN